MRNEVRGRVGLPFGAHVLRSCVQEKRLLPFASALTARYRWATNSLTLTLSMFHRRRPYAIFSLSVWHSLERLELERMPNHSSAAPPLESEDLNSEFHLKILFQTAKTSNTMADIRESSWDQRRLTSKRYRSQLISPNDIPYRRVFRYLTINQAVEPAFSAGGITKLEI